MSALPPSDRDLTLALLVCCCVSAVASIVAAFCALAEVCS